MKLRLLSVVCGMLALAAPSLLSAAPPGNGIRWQTDFRQSSRLAAQQRRPLLVLVTAPWCGHCRRMMRETFADQKVTTLVSANYLPVMVDSDTNSKLAAALGAQALPTTLVMSPELKVLNSTTGYQSPNEMQTTLVRWSPGRREPQVSTSTTVVSAPRPANSGSFVQKYARRAPAPGNQAEVRLVQKAAQ